MAVLIRTQCKPRWVKHLQREHREQDRWGQTSCPNPGDKNLKAGSGGGVGVERASHPLLLWPLYLWVRPHLWVVVKSIKGEGNFDSCGEGRREKSLMVPM